MIISYVSHSLFEHTYALPMFAKLTALPLTPTIKPGNSGYKLEMLS